MPNLSILEKDRGFIEDILEAADKAIGYMEGYTIEAFLKDELRCLAVTRLVEIVGEASSRISKETRDGLTEVPWREMSDARNKAIHDYMDIDYRIIYKIVTDHLSLAIEPLRSRPI